MMVNFLCIFFVIIVLVIFLRWKVRIIGWGGIFLLGELCFLYICLWSLIGIWKLISNGKLMVCIIGEFVKFGFLILISVVRLFWKYLVKNICVCWWIDWFKDGECFLWYVLSCFVIEEVMSGLLVIIFFWRLVKKIWKMVGSEI